MRKKVHARRAVTLAAIIAGVVISSHAMAAPQWQPSGMPSLAVTEDKSLSVRQERRSYVDENGALVEELRIVEEAFRRGALEFASTLTFTTMKNGSSTVVTRTRQNTQSYGQSSVQSQRTTVTAIPGGIRTVHEEAKNGTFTLTGESSSYDKPGLDGLVRTVTVVEQDQHGQNRAKSEWKLFKDGTAAVETRLWNASSSTWDEKGKTEIVKAVQASLIIAPSTATEGHILGGIVENSAAPPGAASTILAESLAGGRVTASVDAFGRWQMEPGALKAGIWFLYPVMPDGKRGNPSILRVFRADEASAAPIVTQNKGLAFAGSAISVAGSGLSGKEPSLVPWVWIRGEKAFTVVEPYVFSDTEMAMNLPSWAPKGSSALLVSTGQDSSVGRDVDIVALTMTTPDNTLVGQEFLMTIKIEGLSDKYMHEDFTVLISVTGPARFVAPDSKDIIVSIRGGTLQLRMVAESPGKYGLSGKLIGYPDF